MKEAEILFENPLALVNTSLAFALTF